MMAERGLCVDHTTISRWVQHYAPELEKRRPHLKTCNDSWKGDETSIKIKKVWMYLYRAVDSQGNTIELLLSSTRDAEAATRFFCKALPFVVDAPPQTLSSKECVASADLTPSVPRVIGRSIKTRRTPRPLLTSKPQGFCLNTWN
jgi:transposase, IS6 family